MRVISRQCGIAPNEDADDAFEGRGWRARHDSHVTQDPRSVTPHSAVNRSNSIHAAIAYPSRASPAPLSPVDDLGELSVIQIPRLLFCHCGAWSVDCWPVHDAMSRHPHSTAWRVAVIPIGGGALACGRAWVKDPPKLNPRHSDANTSKRERDAISCGTCSHFSIAVNPAPQQPQFSG